MKTNQVLTKKMGDFDVLQRTEDGMFNATLLLKQWNDNSKSDKRINDFLDSKQTKEFLEALKSNAEIPAKADSHILTKSRGQKGGTWMHPLLFIDFCMWIYPEFKYGSFQVHIR